tara:strand:- start:39433 stop:39669 length:237 start_codon:yes stop_codon:yes gene_type:complete
VAEMGAATGVTRPVSKSPRLTTVLPTSKSWIGKFKEDKKMFLAASSMAPKAVDYILDYQSAPNGLANLRRLEALAGAG